jgi:hypothetical protein
MLRSTLLVILFAFSGAAFADDFSYNNVNVSYGQMNFDDGSGDADGDIFGVDGSFEISESVFLFAGYGAGDLEDDGGFSVDVDNWRAGVGYHTSVSESFDLVATLSYENVELSAPGLGSVDDSGIGAGVGLRYAASDAFELNAGINYADRGDLEPLIDETSIEAGALYNFNETFSVGLSGEWGEDMSTYTLAGRFYFGQ